MKRKYGHFWIFKSEGLHSWVGMYPVEFDILWCHDSVQVILHENVNSKNTKPLSERVLKRKYGHFWMFKSEGLHTWVGMHPVEFDIFWGHDSVQVILNQNANSKNL